MKLDQALVNAAIDFIKARFPKIGDWDGAAAMYTKTGKILTSTYAESPNDGAGLCNETGSICEAHKLGEEVTASVCVGRSPEGEFHIIAPCGICQERLFFWGPKVEVGVPHPEDPRIWLSKQLQEVQPFYWRTPYLGIERPQPEKESHA
jgi:cytidine deaminase